jgi:hypothetical protein
VLVAEELGGFESAVASPSVAATTISFFCEARPRSRCFFHEALRTAVVDRESALGGEELRHVEREAVGVVEFERRFAAEKYLL